MNRLVTIVIRTKNRPILLKRALSSVSGQTYPHWEAIVVNDGGEADPVDRLVRDAQAKAKGTFRVVHHVESLGMEAASNRGVAQGQGEYVVIHDDDDSWDPEFLAVTTAALDHAPDQLGGVVTPFVRVWETIEGDTVREDSREDLSHWIDEISLWKVCGRNLFPPIAFLYRRSVYDEVGGYDESLPVLGDWEFNLRFLARRDVERVGTRTLALYHHRRTAQAEYGNTVVAQNDRHRLYANRIRNAYLRADFAKGQVGLGFAMNLAHQLTEVSDETERGVQLMLPFYSLSSVLNRAKSAVKGKKPHGS